MESKKRRVAIDKIEESKDRSVCCSKRRKCLFKKAKDLCSKHPSISVHAVVFTPKGRASTFGDPLSLLSNTDQCGQIRSVLSFDASTLSKAEAESQRVRLQELRSALLSKISDKEGASFSGLVYNKIGVAVFTDNTDNLEEFVCLSELVVNSKVSDFAKEGLFEGCSNTVSAAIDPDMSDVNWSSNLFNIEGYANFKVNNHEIGSQFGGEDVDMDLVSFSELGYEAEFEKLRNGYDVFGDKESSGQLWPLRTTSP